LKRSYFVFGTRPFDYRKSVTSKSVVTSKLRTVAAEGMAAARIVVAAAGVVA
jgi:hypothetical protein